ncbi:cytochrome P450 [Streptomyces sp. NPDC057620]|uniref:cytochrome P450 n=1 Tax=Streptomyces sp. NPDC057620 TaxID=3346185 RepID=UPI0036943F89
MTTASATLQADGAKAAAFADRLGINPAFFWMRGHSPERPVEVDGFGVCNVYGYREILEVLRDPRSFSNNIAGLLAATEIDESFSEGALTMTDPPEHTKLRKLIGKAFTPKVVAELEPRIVAITDELLDAVDGRGSLELVNDLAYPMPVMVISELLGVPTSDRHLFKRWVERMSSSAIELTSGERNPNSDADPQAAMRVVPELFDYLRAHTAERRVKPREDLITKLVEAEVDGERLSDGAVVNFANELLVVGHATTSALLGNALLYLDTDPELAARVRADPALTPAVVEETLRLMPPIAVAYKAVLARTEIGGVPVVPGQMVALSIGAANRDERQFDRPHAFDVTRDPNPHLGFSRGIHFCPGAPLARMEGRVALNAVLARFPGLRTDPDRLPTFLPLPHVITASELPLLTS